MSRKLGMVLIAVCLSAALLISGCGPSSKTSAQYNLGLTLTPEQTARYKATTEVIKDFRFDQPNLGKLREEQTKTLIVMGFTQQVQNVDADGSATVKVTINDLAVDIINKNEPKFAFNSANEKDKSSPLAKLLGQQYTIQITPAGRAKLLDAAAALAAVTNGYEKTLAEGLLDPKAVEERHQIQALPKETAVGLSVNTAWSQVLPSPPGLLAPKTYKKVYTLSQVDNNIATVNMVASESTEQADGAAASGGMGMFAKMFDNEDAYTGTMKLDTSTGQVLLSEETLVSSYVAQEMPENADPAKGPDTLTMRFTNRVHLEKLD
ncbi:MAG: hypothetical protein L0Y36_07905 [Planctomycetales bacterium]|nr:hypothetical protein [Planctomycetales bacterium]